MHATFIAGDSLPLRWHDPLVAEILSDHPSRPVICALDRTRHTTWLTAVADAIASSTRPVQIVAIDDDPAPLLLRAHDVLNAAKVPVERRLIARVDWRTWRWAADSGAWLSVSAGPGGLPVDQVILLLEAMGPSVWPRVMWSATGARGIDPVAVPLLHERWLLRSHPPDTGRAMASLNLGRWLDLPTAARQR